jgi:alkanesulfonate monooxygenase SsuD/methylene tetrahydromethanopterin reductase-like flavin-dependent oxidoreductase (luciferase family)
MRTERIRLGTMLSPLSRMRPWKLASETATLDNLSGGRVILSVGLGAVDTGFEAFGEVIDRKTRAELLDEGLEILTGLWGGQPFNFNGKHYQVRETTFHVPLPPVQQPRIPIWVVGAWPREKSMQRALRYDGLLPNVMGADGQVLMSPPSPAEVRQMAEYVAIHRQNPTPYDIILEGQTPGSNPAEAASIVLPYAEAGATWWLEAMWESRDLDEVLTRIRQGPSPVS